MTIPHAFHQNLPPNHFDSDGVPFVTKFAEKKAQQILDLVDSMHLDESFFRNDTVEDDSEDEEDEDPHAFRSQNTIGGLVKKCNRVQAQLSTLDLLKYCIPQRETCRIILHLLNLLCCTIVKDGDTIRLQYENVGYIWEKPEDEQTFQPAADFAQLKRELEFPFALPAPARETILSIIVNLLSNKGPLRDISNSSLYPGNNDKRYLMILHWQPLLRTLLRTAPYLDEHESDRAVLDSSSRQSTILKRTVQMIRDARHFFDQGLRVGGALDDRTAQQIWNMVKSDVLYHSHTHACYRGTIILYLFMPSRCTSEFYRTVMPEWLEAWTNIDRCPEYDFLWLALLCRARKHLDNFDWTFVRKRLLTNSQYWLQLPIGGTTLDKSFPRAANPRSRSCPPRLKAFVGASSTYDEGIDFVAKVAKLLVTSIGLGNKGDISEGTQDILRFLTFVTPYFHPSNLGPWTFTLGAFLHYFSYELCVRVGMEAGMNSLENSNPAIMRCLRQTHPGVANVSLPPKEIVALLHALLPLCQQTLYSKNAHVGRAGEAAMLYLVQIDPKHAAPAFLDFSGRALDVSAVNLAHQAPSALSALTRLIQPSLRADKTVLLSRLPGILHLSLAGIDSNDQNKTIRTLILYRSLFSWLPIGGEVRQWPSLGISSETSAIEPDGTMRVGKDLYYSLEKIRKTDEYLVALNRLPESSLLKMDTARDQLEEDLLLGEASSAVSDWSLEFLERIFGLLRASGEREKRSKTLSGVASRHSSADVQQARNFSRVLKECLLQTFSSMDDEIHQLAVQYVARFLQEETLPEAAKDSSLLCQAVGAIREREDGTVSSPGLDVLVPILTADLRRHSTKTVVYRLRCLSGAVRMAGNAILKYQAEITEAIGFAIASEDRHLIKTGCKLLRHTLFTLTESYPIVSDSRPRVFCEQSSRILGRSSQLHNDRIKWHVPSGDCVEFAWELLKTHVWDRIESLCEQKTDDTGVSHVKLFSDLDIGDLRRCVRVIFYSIRGGASLMLDNEKGDSDNLIPLPHEIASHKILCSASESTKQAMYRIRGRLTLFTVVLLSAIASDILYPDAVLDLPENVPSRKAIPLISSDAKVCKDTSNIAALLLTRRGASFRSQEARTVWKAQKQLATDFPLCAQVDHMIEILQSASSYGAPSVLYKDGEDAGKTVPRRLLLSRVQLFHDSLIRNASFEVPRRLRRLDRNQNARRSLVFSAKSSLTEMIANMESLLLSAPPRALDVYEGLFDGLYAISCHSNTQMRALAISLIDYSMTRFGWLIVARIPRILSALALDDAEMNGKFGIPSCARLVDRTNTQGKRKRLAEAIKGVTSIIALPRATRLILSTERMRLKFVETVCRSDKLVSMLPAEEMQKVILYLHSLFSPYRSKMYYLPRANPSDKESHSSILRLSISILSERKINTDVTNTSEIDNDNRAVHWRKMLLGAWFLLSSIDGDDHEERKDSKSILDDVWLTCFYLIEHEMGQPLQKVALGLLGKLIILNGINSPNPWLMSRMTTESFCRALVNALVYDHKEDTSFSGGHSAQWSAGVEDIIRDSARHIAPRTLFPFQRSGQGSGTFKASHSQIIEEILSRINTNERLDVALLLLGQSKELALASPSEDQRNQQSTSAEIFAGICGFFLRNESPSEMQKLWTDHFLPHFDGIVSKTPFSLMGCYFDALRYALQFCSPSLFYPLTSWLVEKIRFTLWQPSNADNGRVLDYAGAESTNGSMGTESFTVQSKWMYMFSAVVIELDESESHDTSRRLDWYVSYLVESRIESHYPIPLRTDDLDKSWNLVSEYMLGRLTEALGHPFDLCRDHIARCLFRICYCHRKRIRDSVSRVPSSLEADTGAQEVDPGLKIVGKLQALTHKEYDSFKDKCNALGTARRFMSYCIQLGEAKFEYSDYVIPLLPLAFEALESTLEKEMKSNVDSEEENAAKHALEADVIKNFRILLADVSVTVVISYGKQSDIRKVLDIVGNAAQHPTWQVRHASANFLRCFQGAHMFLLDDENARFSLDLAASLLCDQRREVSSAAMAALTGILSASPEDEVSALVKKYSSIASKTKMQRRKRDESDPEMAPEQEIKERKRAHDQQLAVYFLSACVLARPYDTPSFIPKAIAAISKHSFEKNAPLSIRDTVKRCCAEFKRTHVSDNWEVHREAFSQEQLEALEDVVSSPHYYA